MISNEPQDGVLSNYTVKMTFAGKDTVTIIPKDETVLLAIATENASANGCGNAPR